MNRINTNILMSGAEYFSDEFAINAYMDSRTPVSVQKAMAEHELIRQSLIEAGVEIIKVPAPPHCQDGVYTANWALCREDTAVMASLPNKRKGEEAFAERHLRDLGMRIVKVPDGLRCSGQGDALPCGNLLLCGSVYRTDSGVHDFLASTLGFETVSLQTRPQLDSQGGGEPVINATTGWPDSFFYDIDLAISILRAPTANSPGLIAWCPDAFMPESVETIRQLSLDKIEVSYEEATKAFACNLVSTGEVVVMSAHAPHLQQAIEAKGLRTITPEISELGKGGGYIRCTGLTLRNA